MSTDDLNDVERQKKQEEMIRQYLEVANIDRNTSSENNSILESDNTTPLKTTTASLSTLNLNELRRDLQSAEERLQVLRLEVKKMQKQRDESFTNKPPPPPYVPPSSINKTNQDHRTHNNSSPINRNMVDETTLLAQFRQKLSMTQPADPRQTTTSSSSSLLLPKFNLHKYSPSASVDISKDHRQQQFLLTMRQHREQLVVYIDSLKQALDSLDRLASLEPTRSEVHLANMKLDKIQQKRRQLHALKSNRSSQQSPFIECRIRQLERDLVHILSEHQKDVQAKLELNEQRSLMLLKIMQVTDELASVDQQIQQLLALTVPSTDVHRVNPSQLSHELNEQSSFRATNLTNSLDNRLATLLESPDNNLTSKLTTSYYLHHH